MSMEYWEDRYILEYHEAVGNKASYIRSVNCAIKRYLLDRYGELESGLFTTEDAEQTARDLVENPDVTSQNYVSIVFNWLKHFCQFVTDYGGMAENPYERIEKPVLYV